MFQWNLMYWNIIYDIFLQIPISALNSVRDLLNNLGWNNSSEVQPSKLLTCVISKEQSFDFVSRRHYFEQVSRYSSKMIFSLTACSPIKESLLIGSLNWLLFFGKHDVKVEILCLLGLGYSNYVTICYYYFLNIAIVMKALYFTVLWK